MKRALLTSLALLLLAGCAGRRPELLLTSEPSIERAFDILEGTRLGKPLVKFIYKYPVRFEYSNSAGNCHKFAIRRGLIYLPSEMRGSDLVLALALGRAAYIYRLYMQTGMEEILSEEEELSALFQARLGIELNLTEGDFGKAPEARAVRSMFCTYIMHKPSYAMAQARKEALAVDPDCQRPLDTLDGQRLWLAKMRKAVNDDNFARLLYERDLDRVRRGVLSMSEAMKNDARNRALPAYEVYRMQRTYYDAQDAVFQKFEQAMKEEQRLDGEWLAAHAAELRRARENFSDCDMPI